jgi:protein YIPF5/7
MWQDNSNGYGASSSQNPYYAQPLVPETPLQFYAPSGSPDPNTFYPGSRPSLDGHVVGAQGTISQQGVVPGYGGNIQSAGGWWTAFGTAGFDGEPPLLEGRKV